MQKGIPDYFAHRKNSHLFIEVKLEHEQIKKHQWECIKLLERFGFKVMVIRFKRKVYRVRTFVDTRGDIHLNKTLQKRKVVEIQQKLRLRY